MTPEQALIHFFEEGIAFNKLVGMQVSELGPERCQITVPFKPELLGDPLRPALHGGVLSSVADTTGGLAVFARHDFTRVRVSTVDLRVDYLRPGLAEPIFCDAHVVRAGNKVAVTTMVIWQGSRDYVVADCRGVYNVVRKAHAPGRDD